MSNNAQLIQQLRNMAMPFMDNVLNLLSSMQSTIDEQNKRINSLEKHCGIDYTPSPQSQNNTLSLDLSITNNTPSPSPEPSSEQKTVSSTKAPKTQKKDTKDGNKKLSRLERMQNRSRDRKKGGSDIRSKSANPPENSKNNNTRATSSSNQLVKPSSNEEDVKQSDGGNDDNGDNNVVEYRTKKLNFLFKPYKDDIIKSMGNGKSCKKADMKNGTIQFGKEISYENDFEQSKIIKYLMCFDTKGGKIPSGCGFGIAFIDSFNDYDKRNSGDNSSFHIRGNGKIFLSDGFELLNDSFDSGKKALYKDGESIAVELNLELMQCKVYNYALKEQNKDFNDNVTVQIRKKNKRLAFIVYLGGGKARVIGIKTQQAFYKK